MEYYVGLDVSLELTSICVVLFGANSNEGNARGGLHDARVLRVWSFGDIHPLEHDIQEKQMLCLRRLPAERVLSAITVSLPRFVNEGCGLPKIKPPATWR